MSLSQKDINKLNSIAKVLGNALAELEEIASKVDQQIDAPRKRRNLKQERKDKYEYRLKSGKMRRQKVKV